MQRATNSTIVIEEVGEYGVIDIAAANLESIEEVKQRILKITGRPEIQHHQLQKHFLVQ
jgi:hypothetical protein